MQRIVPMALTSLLLGLSACASTPEIVYLAEADAEGVFIHDISIFDPHTLALLPHQDILMTGADIIAVGEGLTDVPAGIRTIEGDGLSAIAGLIDGHVHISFSSTPPGINELPDPELNALRFLYAGITTVMDLGGKLKDLEKLKQKIDSGKILGPDLNYAGPHIAIKGGHPAAMIYDLIIWPLSKMIASRLSFEVENAADIADAVSEIKKHGGSLVKVTLDELPLGAPYLDSDLLNVAVTEGKAVGLRTIAHIGDDGNARQALDSDVKLFAHNVYRDVLSEETAALMAQNNVGVMPTIGVFDSTDAFVRGEVEPWPLLVELMRPDILEAVQEGGADLDLGAMGPWLEVNHAGVPLRLQNAATLKRHGVTLLVGSDSPSFGWEAGAGLHREIDLLVKAGYTLPEVLKAVTYTNAQEFDFKDRGEIKVGNRADILLVKGDITQDIAAHQDIHSVIHNGQILKRRPIGQTK